MRSTNIFTPPAYRIQSDPLGPHELYVYERLHLVRELPTTVCCQRKLRQVTLMRGFPVCPAIPAEAQRGRAPAQTCNAITFQGRTVIYGEAPRDIPRAVFADMERCGIGATLLNGCTGAEAYCIRTTTDFMNPGETLSWSRGITSTSIGLPDIEKAVFCLYMAGDVAAAQDLVTASGEPIQLSSRRMARLLAQT